MEAWSIYPILFSHHTFLEYDIGFLLKRCKLNWNLLWLPLQAQSIMISEEICYLVNSQTTFSGEFPQIACLCEDFIYHLLYV